jgi:hypothetical protein
MKEDLMATNQMENLKEMASAPFGPNSNPLMTREQYVNKIQQIPDFEPQKTDKEDVINQRNRSPTFNNNNP